MCITSHYVSTCNSYALHILDVCVCVCEGAAVHTSSTVVSFLVSGIPIVYCILNVTYAMYKLRFFFHYLFVKIALFTGLLFASIAVIPHIHVDIGLDQELALPKVMDKNDFFVFFCFCFQQGAVLELRRIFRHIRYEIAKVSRVYFLQLILK